ncbi:MAG: hypothetical protein ACE5E6_06430 [Phycisphaerae bacterium]
MKRSKRMGHGHGVVVVAAVMAAPAVLVGTAVSGCAATTGVVQDGPGVKKRPRRSFRRRPDNAPEVGAIAPDFNLKLLDTDKHVALSSFQGEQPVVLVFGSYT